METLLQGIVVVGLSVGLALFGLWATRRFVSHEDLAPHNDVAGFIFATASLAYAVVLAFVVIAVWEEFNDARAFADQEANAVADLYRLAGGYPDPWRARIRTELVSYAESVIDREWDEMAADGEPIPETIAEVDQLWEAHHAAGQDPAVAASLYQASLEQLDALGDGRRLRLLSAGSGLPGVMWVVLIAGAALTIGFSYLFGVENRRSQAVMIALLTTAIALLLFLTWSLESPFTRNPKIEPDGLELVLRMIAADPAA